MSWHAFPMLFFFQSDLLFRLGIEEQKSVKLEMRKQERGNERESARGQSASSRSSGELMVERATNNKTVVFVVFYRFHLSRVCDEAQKMTCKLSTKNGQKFCTKRERSS